MEEDETTVGYRDCMDQLDTLKKLNLTNLALALIKCQRYTEGIAFC